MMVKKQKLSKMPILDGCSKEFIDLIVGLPTESTTVFFNCLKAELEIVQQNLINAHRAAFPAVKAVEAPTKKKAKAKERSVSKRNAE